MYRKIICILTVAELAMFSYASASPAIGELMCVNAGAIACKNQATFDEIRSYSGDDAAVKKAVTTAVMYGLCLYFEKSEKVYKDDTAIFKEMSQFHVPGQLDRYWVLWKQTSDDLNSCQAPAPPKTQQMSSPAQAQAPNQSSAGDATKKSARSQRSTEQTDTGTHAANPCVIKPVMTDEDIANCRQ